MKLYLIAGVANVIDYRSGFYEYIWNRKVNNPPFYLANGLVYI